MSNFYHNMERGKAIEKPQITEPTVPTIQEVDQITSQAEEAMQEVQEQVQQEPQVVRPEIEVESSQAKNFRQLKEAKERAERERDELLKHIQTQQRPQQESESVDEDFDINPDDIVEGKHLKKYYEKIKKLEKKLQQTQQQSVAMTTEAKLKAQFPDFDKVVNKDNIESLKYAYPELANTLNASTDLYSTAVSAYTMIKKLGIAQEDLYEADRERVQKNAAKPKPLVSIAPQKSESPLSNANAFANGLTPELQKQLWKEMQDLRKRG